MGVSGLSKGCTGGSAADAGDAEAARGALGQPNLRGRKRIEPGGPGGRSGLAARLPAGVGPGSQRNPAAQHQVVPDRRVAARLRCSGGFPTACRQGGRAQGHSWSGCPRRRWQGAFREEEGRQASGSQSGWRGSGRGRRSGCRSGSGCQGRQGCQASQACQGRCCWGQGRHQGGEEGKRGRPQRHQGRGLRAVVLGGGGQV
mmetsp:Transcript_18116/g.54552  ORF Transcript_18116/g.54552 Transcript_18116/m.54552 type:complete len:201 (-) Transcript_18116:6418-7020(-)